MARASACATSPTLRASCCSSAGDELDAALEELRELARGIHPAVLSDRGLDAALETLAHRAPRARGAGGRRRASGCPRPVELAAYFVVAEALTNVAKYARASARTRERGAGERARGGGGLDDGVGGADPARGSGPARPGRPALLLDGTARGRRPRRAGARRSRASDPVRVVVADDSVLLREGIVRLLEEAELRGGGPGRRRRGAAAQGRRPQAGRGRGGHPHAADEHRRRPARRARDPRARSRTRRCSCSPSTWRRATRSSWWATPPAAWATC